MSQAGVDTLQTKYWRLLRIRGKITEAKQLEIGKITDNKDVGEFYCVARMDNQQANEYTTQLVSSSNSPFWAEEFEFETRIGCKEIKMVLWMQQKTNGDLPIGKVVIPRNCIKSGDDQWYMLMDASYETKGSIQIKIKHFPPKPQRKVHGFSVTIVKCRDLAGKSNDVNPFVVLHLLPDKDAISTQHTHCHQKTCDPPFQEMFFFTCNANQDAMKRELHVAVWSQSTAAGQTPTFLGHCSIPLAPVMTKKTTCRWYSLTSLDSDSELSIAKKGHKKSYSEDERRNRPREFVKQVQLTDGGPQIQKSHHWTEKTFALSTCSLCNSVMMGAHLSCLNCSFVCHQKCKEQIPPTCGGMGAIRLKLDIVKSYVMEMEHYEPLLQKLREDDYKALIVLGKVSNSREEAAKCLIRIENGNYFSFVKSVVFQEIQSSDSVSTLFRANSMATKALDVYMKHVGSEYLRSTLEDVLKLVLLYKKPFELDPTRITQEKPEKLEGRKRREASIDAPDTNALNLIEMNAVVTERIFKSASNMPGQLKLLFNMIQKTVKEKFPDNENAPYTAVSGFIFLRFFAPAVLGPALFGLKVGTLDQSGSRKLLLIAKTLQNLSNLVEFGQKEPFMAPMNPFIKDKIKDMKKFIDTISSCSDEEAKQEIAPQQYSKEAVCKDCADLHVILSGAIEKMKSSSPEVLVLNRIEHDLMMLDAKQKYIQGKEQESKYDLLHDTGVEAEESELNEVVKDSEEEKKIMRMLTRCASTDSIGSDGSAGCSIGSYRNSVELRDSITKGQLVVQGPPPITFISADLTTDLTEMTNEKPSVDDLIQTLESTLKKKPPSVRGRLKRNETFSESTTTTIDEQKVLESHSSSKTHTPSTVRKKMSIISMKSRVHSTTLSRDSVPTAPMAPNSSCPRCNKELKDTFTTVENKRYHADCVTCASCKSKIHESAFFFKDDIYCKGCYYHQNGLICGECDKAIMRDYLVLNDVKYHPSCRTCSVCNTSIKGKEHVILGTSIFCADHKDAVICYSCQKRIEGDVVQSNEKFFHPNHFNCYGCGKDINGCVVYELRNQVWCQQCFLSQEDTKVSSGHDLKAFLNKVL